jgi:hypothetical protein
MTTRIDWDLSAIPDLSTWLYHGLFAFHAAENYGDRMYALAPIELNDSDYVFLQIVRQVRTFDRKSLPRLADANDAAIRRWCPNYGIKPLLDMIGLVQELGSRSLGQYLSDLTLPSVLNRLSDDEREQLFASLVEALIPQSEFRFDSQLYPAFLKLANSPASLREPVLARALAALATKSPTKWQNILRDCVTHFRSKFNVDPAESPLGVLFFAIEANLPREHFKDLFEAGGQVSYPVEDMWTIPWLFGSRHPDRSNLTPLTFRGNNQEAFWVGFASRPNDQMELKKENLRHSLVQAIDREYFRQRLARPESNVQQLDSAIRTRAAGQSNLAEESVQESKRDDSDVILRALKSRRA